MIDGRQIKAGEVEEGNEILLTASPERWGVVEDARTLPDTSGSKSADWRRAIPQTRL